MAADKAREMALWVLGLLLAFVREVLERTIRGLWKEMWDRLLEAIAAAEARWQAGEGQKKKAEVMREVLAYLDTKAQLNWLQKMLVRLLLDKLIDALIDQINATLGHDWKAMAEAYKAKLEAALPIV